MEPTREELQQAVVDAVLALVAASGSTSFCGTIANTTPQLYIAFGEPDHIVALLQDNASDDGSTVH